jgi:hypothetical protein
MAGTPTYWHDRSLKTLFERFTAKYRVNPETGCWEWQASGTPDGYGSLWEYGRLKRAHRVGYELYRGPIPEGMHLDHLCRNRGCVNPDHLQVISNRENILRGECQAARNARKTHCKRGHPLSGDNLSPARLKRGQRECLECARAGRRLRAEGVADDADLRT